MLVIAPSVVSVPAYGASVSPKVQYAEEVQSDASQAQSAVSAAIKAGKPAVESLAKQVMANDPQVNAENLPEVPKVSPYNMAVIEAIRADVKTKVKRIKSHGEGGPETEGVEPELGEGPEEEAVADVKPDSGTCDRYYNPKPWNRIDIDEWPFGEVAHLQINHYYWCGNNAESSITENGMGGFYHFDDVSAPWCFKERNAHSIEVAPNYYREEGVSYANFGITAPGFVENCQGYGAEGVGISINAKGGWKGTFAY
ncbi:MAG TPA: hypothetical protein VL989_02035 [Candidatus Sulfotelmatobacter sp.]|nr:hypothetical protein [Candidatus Sulfotelmatobacter sp.]